MGPRYDRAFYTPEEVQRLEWNLIEIGDLSVTWLGEDNKIVQKRDNMIREILGAETGKPGKEVFQRLISLLEEDPLLYADRLSRLDMSFARAMDALITEMAGVSRAITVSDLPESIRDQLLSNDGTRNLVVAYPHQTIINSENGMRRFADRMSSISPPDYRNGSGYALLVGRGNGRFGQSGGIHLIVVFLFLLLTFRNLRSSL